MEKTKIKVIDGSDKYKNCSRCEKKLSQVDIFYLQPSDLGRFCVKCRNSIRQRFLSWLILSLIGIQNKLFSVLNKRK